MRFLVSLFALLVLACTLPPAPAYAAARQAPAPIDKLVADFNALEKDAQRGGRRDLWLEMESKFSALAKKSSGTTAARALYYEARSRQELGKRSFLAADHKAAAARFAALAAKYPKSSLTPNSLFRAGSILEHRLGDHAGAVAVLERMLKSYPNAKDAPAAKKLLGEAKGALQAQSAGTGATARRTTGNASGAQAKGSSVTLRSITWKGKQQRAVLTLELDGKTEFAHTFVPPDKTKKTPGRLHLDLANTLPASAVKAGMSPKGLVVSRISTLSGKSGTRITFECDGVQCYAVSASKQNPRIVTVELSRADDIKGGVTVAGSKKSAPKGDAVIEQLGLTVQTIMIDAGHGGKDPGAMAGGIIERQFTLDMARRVGTLLKQKGFTVLYTRSGNRYIALPDRPEAANLKNADLFISIHVNANKNTAIRGLEIYYLDEAKTQDAALAAARENGVSVKELSDLQFILTDFMLSSKLKESRHLADCVHKGILGNLRRSKVAAYDNGVRAGPFYVLMGARMPAILVEFGYITNSGDLANLKSDRFLQRQAEGLVEGVLRYKADLAKMAPR